MADPPLLGKVSLQKVYLDMASDCEHELPSKRKNFPMSG